MDGSGAGNAVSAGGAAAAVQAPVQIFSGNVSAGLKDGLLQARLLLNKAAAATATGVGAAAAAVQKSTGSGGGKNAPEPSAV